MSNTASPEKVFSTRRAERMVGREEEWGRLQKALEPGGPLRVVLVRGRGGLGKSRLLEEVVRAAGRTLRTPHTPERAHPFPTGKVLVADIMDAGDIKLHDRYQFVLKLRQMLTNVYRSGVNFANYEAQRGRVNNLRANGALYKELMDAEEKLVAAFITELQAITREHRVVLIFDTVERLGYAGPKWLFTEDILTPSDLGIRTYHWLLDIIAHYNLDNVTLVLSGRDQTNEYASDSKYLEGSDFFDAVRDAVRQAQDNGRRVDLEDIPLRPLSDEATREFFEQLADQSRQFPPIAEAYRLAADPHSDRYKVIRFYTRGIPLRMSLYAQIIVEANEIPAAFSDAYDDTRQEALRQFEDKLSLNRRVANEGKTIPVEGHDNTGLSAADRGEGWALMEEVRIIEWAIEEEFIKILFGQSNNLRRRIVLLLLRTPRGLTVQQVDFALNAPKDKKAWHAYLSQPIDDNRIRALREYWELLTDISNDYWSKPANSGLSDDVSLEDMLHTVFRLQDELYRIYAEHMGLFAAPLSPETQYIRMKLAHQQNSYDRSRTEEMERRQPLYEKLAFYADYHYQKSLERKQAYLREDEARFEENFVLERPNTYVFPALSLSQQFDRLDLNEALTAYEIERMVYRLLLHPDENLNSDYISLEDDNDKASRHESDFWAQTEMWRVLHESWSIKFAPLYERELAKSRGESSVAVLWRVAEQESVARWIKRFVLRGEARRAIEFSAKVEEKISEQPFGEEKSPERNSYLSWNHTLTREERAVWTQVAYIRLGEDVQTALHLIHKSVERLVELHETPVGQPAHTGSQQTENGFAPVTEGQPQPPHPAYVRLQRLLSHAHNYLGFAYRTQGQMLKAVEHYAKTLEYVRTDRNEMVAHRGKVLNNHSRALSELGWNSLGACLDGRDLRLSMAEEVPLASSYNTLALIYDDMGRYEDAPLLSAKAIAYCRRAAEKRQLGLSLRQMAESLRHVAERLRTGQRAAGSPDSLLDAAEELLNEARAIFFELGESERQIEVNIEYGSLLRDRLDFASDEAKEGRGRRIRSLYYTEALNLLDGAASAARAAKLQQHVLDAQVNQARVHFYSDNTTAAEEILDEIARDEANKKHIIRRHAWPEDSEAEVKKARDDFYIGKKIAAVDRLNLLDKKGDYRQAAAEDDWPTNPDLRNTNWVFRQLSTAQRIRGQIAFGWFDRRIKELREQYPEDDTPQKRAQRVRDDKSPGGEYDQPKQYAQDALSAAAIAYALAYAYASLYSSRSRTIGSLESDLYNHIRKFNRSELNALRGHLRAVEAYYPVLAQHSLPTLDLFMDEFFGRELIQRNDQGTFHE